MSDQYKIVYTVSGSRYLLDQKNMKWTEAKLNKHDVSEWFDLVEWPEIEEGKRLRLVYKTKDHEMPRLMSTTEVLGHV